jgi:uncharacterized protein involved in outer membrane biogenesis
MLARLMRIVLAAVGLIVVVVAAGLAGVAWHPDSLRPLLARFLSDQLQREVTIAGPLKLDPGRVTTVEIAGLRVAAPDWAQSEYLAAVERLRVGADLWAYLRHGEIRITELVLARPSVALERDAQGRTSWPSTGSKGGGGGGGGGPPPRIAVDRFEVSDGSLDLRDATVPLELSARLASERAGPGDLALRLDGNGSLRGDPLELGLRLATGSPAPLTVDGALALADGRLTVAGGIADPVALRGVDVRLELTSPDSAGFLALAGRTVEQAPPLAASARLTGDRERLELELGRLALGRSALAGRLVAGLKTPTTIEGEVRAELIDLGELLPLLGGDGPSAPPSANPLRALAPYRGQVELAAATIRLPTGAELRDAGVRLTLGEDGLQVPLRVVLPEGSVAGEIATGPLDRPQLTVTTRLAAEAVGIGPLAGEGYAGTVDGNLAGDVALGAPEEMLRRSRLRLEAEAAGLAVPQAELGGIVVTAVLEDGRLTLAPLRATLPEGEISGRVAAGPFGPDFAAEIDLDAKGVDLAAAARSDAVGGRFDGRIEGTLHGTAPLDLLTRSRVQVTGTVADLRLPTLERQLDRVEIDASLDPERREALAARVSGQAGDRPLAVSLFGGSVETLAQNRGDYPFTLRSELGNNRVGVNGTVTLPLTERRFAATIEAEGQDPSPVLALFELPRLQIPPYRLRGAVSNRGDELRVRDFDGKVGDSDLTADLVIGLAGERPRIAGTLRSRVLDADDLGGLVGVTPATGPGETASAGQEREAEQLERRAEVLPDEPIDPARWRRVDLDLDVRADRIHAGDLPLDGFAGKVAMTDGLLQLDDIDLALGGGHLTGRFEADGRQNPVRGEVDLTLQRVSMARLLNRLDVDVAAFGTLSGQAQGGVGVGGRGRSIKQILADSDGEVRLLMEGGQVDRTIVAAAGLDLLRLLGAATGATPEMVTLNCALADLDIRDGVVTTDPLVIDTEIAELGGQGTVNLADETIDISLTARPKETPLLTDLTGIAIGGRLGEPEIEINPLAVAARGVAAATLGLVLKPFTALAGEASDPEGSGCARLLAREQSEPGG